MIEIFGESKAQQRWVMWLGFDEYPQAVSVWDF
jgi:hypothetical protein